MRYKTIFNRLKKLILSPSSEWEVIGSEDNQGISVVNQFALPLIALCTAAAFIGTSIYLDGFNLEEALKQSLLVFCSLYATVFLAMGVLYFLSPRFGIEQDKNRFFTFATYASSVIFAVKFVTELFPELFFLKILNLYTAYIIWEGVTPLLKVNEEQKPAFVVLASFVIIAGNYLMFRLLHLLLPGV